MNDENDYNFRMLLWIGIPTAVLAILYQSAIAIEKHLLQPTFKFCTWYLTNYGLITAILIFLCVMTYSAFKYYFQSIDRLTEIFETETKKKELAVNDLQNTVTALREKLSTQSKKLGEQSDQLQLLNREILSLKEKNQSLETENERLKNPEAFHFKQKSKIQKEHTENLKASIHQTNWRETK